MQAMRAMRAMSSWLRGAKWGRADRMEGRGEPWELAEPLGGRADM